MAAPQAAWDPRAVDDADNGDFPESLTWRLVRSYLERHGAVRHQLESFDHFITNLLPLIITDNSDVSYMHSSGAFSHHLHFCNVAIRQPTCREVDGFECPLMPHMARLRGFTYGSLVLADLVHDKVNTGDPACLVSRKIYRNVVLCRLPVIIHSRLCYLKTDRDTRYECALDRGGYFIVNGVEKALLGQEKLRTNFPYVFPCRSTTRFEYVCEVRSCHELKMRSTSTLYIFITRSAQGSLPTIAVQLPFIDNLHVPLVALFRLLGAQGTEDIMRYLPTLCEEEVVIVRSCLDSDVRAHSSPEEILDWIGREGTTEATREKRLRYLEHILTNELLPHMGLQRDAQCNQRKMFYLGHMVAKLLAVAAGRARCDDRDDYANKRIDTSGVLMSLLFCQLYRNMLKGLGATLGKVVESNQQVTFNAGDLVNHRKITSGFQYAFATGNWGVQKGGPPGQTGVAQVVSRMTTVSAIANLRRTNTPISRDGKAPKPRQLHCTAWGIVCPADTPEGSSCGLIKNLAILAHVRVGAISVPIAEVALGIPGTPVTPVLSAGDATRRTGALIFINGVIIGYVDPAHLQRLAAALRARRRRHEIPIDASVSVSNGALYVNSDPGCLMRPVVLVERLGDLLAALLRSAVPHENAWNRALREGMIEYMDKQEE